MYHDDDDDDDDDDNDDDMTCQGSKITITWHTSQHFQQTDSFGWNSVYMSHI